MGRQEHRSSMLSRQQLLRRSILYLPICRTCFSIFSPWCDIECASETRNLKYLGFDAEVYQRQTLVLYCWAIFFDVLTGQKNKCLGNLSFLISTWSSDNEPRVCCTNFEMSFWVKTGHHSIAELNNPSVSSKRCASEEGYGVREWWTERWSLIIWFFTNTENNRTLRWSHPSQNQLDSQFNPRFCSKSSHEKRLCSASQGWIHSTLRII